MSDEHSSDSAGLTDHLSAGLEWARAVDLETQEAAKTLDEQHRGKPPRTELRALVVRKLMGDAFGRYEQSALKQLIRVCKLEDLGLQTDFAAGGGDGDDEPPGTHDEDAETDDQVRRRLLGGEERFG